MLILLSSALFVACQSSSAAEIELGKLYYIKELRTGAFHYYGTDRAVTRPSDKNLGRNDPSYCVFEDDFTRFKIGFFEWVVERDSLNNIVRQGWLTPPFVTEFIATNIKRGNGSLTADLSGIVDGRVVHYSLYTDSWRIIIRSDVTYDIKADTGDYTVVRDAMVASFVRETPSYISAGGAK